MAIEVFRFDYEMDRNRGGDHNMWTAYIAAYNMQEAINYLRGTVGPVRISAQGLECRLDAITDSVRKVIVESSKRRPGRPKGSKTKK